MQGLTIGAHVAMPTAAATVESIAAAEQAGLDAVWMTSGGVAPDPFAVLAAAAMKTDRIKFGTSIVPTFPRHPLAMAQGAIAVDQLAPGRLRLGIGPSHKPTIEGMFGLEFERPLQHLREYVTILRALLQEGTVDFKGERLEAHARLAAPTGVAVMVSALRANSFRLAGEIAEGAIPWVCPLPYLRDVAVPAINQGAAKAGRTPPPLIAHVPVCVSTDPDVVREAARRQIGFYPRVPFYSRMFQDAGFPEAAEGQMSDRMIDALVIHGDADQVKARLRDVKSFGASELLAMPIVPPDDAGAWQRTITMLGELARE